MGGTAATWRFLSSEGRTVNGVVALASVALPVTGFLFVVSQARTAGRIGLLIVAVCLLLYTVSGRFSVGFLHVLLVGSSVVVLVGLALVGRDETAEKRLEGGRGGASSLAARLAEAVPRPAMTPPATTPPTAGATRALDALDAAAATSPAEPAVVERARRIARELRALLTRPAAPEVLVDLDRRITALTAPGLVAQATEASKAVAAALTQSPSPPPPPSMADADTAVKDLCQAAGGVFTDGRPRLCNALSPARTGKARPPLDELGVRRAKAELEVARYRLAAAPSDEARKAIAAEVGTKETEYAKAVRERVAGIEDVDAVDTVRTGAGAVVAGLPGLGDSSRSNDVPLALGVVGWALLGALGFYAYRLLLRRATTNAVGPVTVVPDEGDKELERFRTYLLRNVPDPGAVPGADALQPVTDLLGAAPGTAAGLINKVLTALTKATTEKRGYTVTFKSVGPGSASGAEQAKPLTAPGSAAATPSAPPSPGAPPAAPTAPPAAPPGAPAAPAGGHASTATGSERTIAVRVNESRTGKLVAQRMMAGTPEEDPVRQAAYWAAATVLQRSDRVPPWARWSSSTYKALAAFYAKEDIGRGDINRIIEAVKGAPTSGVLCLQLAYEYALDDCHFESFELTLRAATLYRRFVVARYRVALGASLLASDMDGNWWRRDAAERHRVLAALERYPTDAGRNLCDWLRETPADAQAAVTALCRFALKELDEVANLLDTWTLLFNALRRSERSYWLAFLGRDREGMNGRTQFRRAVASARPAIRARGGLTVNLGDAKDWEKDERTFWQVSYNLACYDAVRHGLGGYEEAAQNAMRRLETAVERPNSHQLTSDWVRKDPDLDSLRTLDRFTKFVGRLPDDTRRDDAVET